jgi:hypothetical protein
MHIFKGLSVSGFKTRKTATQSTFQGNGNHGVSVEEASAQLD